MKAIRALQSLPEVFGVLFGSGGISGISVAARIRSCQPLCDCSASSGQSLVINLRSPSVDDSQRRSAEGRGGGGVRLAAVEKLGFNEVAFGVGPLVCSIRTDHDASGRARSEKSHVSSSGVRAPPPRTGRRTSAPATLLFQIQPILRKAKALERNEASRRPERSIAASSLTSKSLLPD